MVQSLTQKPNRIIWCLLDGKPGHEKQSGALLQALGEVFTITVKMIQLNKHGLSLFYSYLFRKPPFQSGSIEQPDLIIGTGHKTHLPMLLLKQRHCCQCVVIMKPSLPTLLFDAVITPEHDYNSSKIPKNVITTVVPLAKKVVSSPNAQEGLVLLGGHSKHYEWSDREIAVQIEALIAKLPRETHWLLSTSRRSPPSTLAFLQNHLSDHKNITLLDYQTLEPQWLEDKLCSAGHIWISPDSASMIGEALMTKAKVGIFSLKAKQQNGKLVAMNTNLLKQTHILSIENVTAAVTPVNLDKYIKLLLEKIH